ncbi:hypothetical protein [Flavobacterium sp. N1994]|uniref:hypothetical protein n=1 Tax=Flavobacterium sp. N1994 TaxID=2986827 RepID=UPI0022239E47|nr:hypothetical protein [Flavobacterium sp. N1994]
MTRTAGRVVLSRNPKENLELAQKVYDKHVSLGADSPLRLLEDVDWSISGPKIADAKRSNEQAEFHKGEMEKEYAKRDLLLPEVVNALKTSIKLLKASYGGNPKKLTDWGISIDDTPKAKKPKE